MRDYYYFHSFDTCTQGFCALVCDLDYLCGNKKIEEFWYFSNSWKQDLTLSFIKFWISFEEQIIKFLTCQILKAATSEQSNFSTSSASSNTKILNAFFHLQVVTIYGTLFKNFFVWKALSTFSFLYTIFNFKSRHLSLSRAFFLSL